LAGAETVSTYTQTGGTLGGSGQTLTAGSYALQGGTVDANLGTGTATASTGTTTINGNLGGALTANSGTANLNGTVSGNVTVSGGTVNLGSADRIGNSSAVNVSSGALNLGGNDSVGAVTLTGGTIGGSGVLTGTSYAVQDGTISAGIGGSGAMTKTGAGTTTLSANNSGFSGAVAVNEGAILASTSGALGSGTVTVTNGSTLAASGVTLANDFTIGSAAGMSAGTNVFIAGWDFQTTANGGTAIAAAPSTPTSILANFGNQAGAATMLLNGSNGSSTWITATSGNQLTAFGGTAINATNTFVSPSVAMSTTTSGAAALAVQGSSANGQSMVFSLNMSNIASLSLSYASQRTGTGFNSHVWEYSSDASSWTAFWTCPECRP
jgi:autotransporter-associated beta strand protein